MYNNILIYVVAVGPEERKAWIESNCLPIKGRSRADQEECLQRLCCTKNVRAFLLIGSVLYPKNSNGIPSSWFYKYKPFDWAGFPFVVPGIFQRIPMHSKYCVDGFTDEGYWIGVLI